MKLVRFSLLTSAVILAAGCFGDPPLFYTPLPNGLEHASNGGRFGSISLPRSSGLWTPIYPVEGNWHCDTFAILGESVIGVETVYGKRSFDPKVETRWFHLDTKACAATTFVTLDELRIYCKSLGFSSMPAFSARTAETSQKPRL
jgi:hypothetical protein